jgi:hypothetical protein
MKRVKLGSLLAGCLLTLAPLQVVRAASGPIEIAFVKDCPAFTCWETAASPVEVATQITGGRLSGKVFHYTAIETLSSAVGYVTIEFRGALILSRDPNLTVLQGTVASGSWNGLELAGAEVHASAIRLHDTTFGGSIWILPKTAS